MKKRFLIMVLLSLLGLSTQALARGYKIELLIFAQDMPNTETFDQTESKIDWPQKVVSRSEYKSVSPQYMNLKGSYSKMMGSQNYRPIMHVGWIQSVGRNRKGTAVQVTNPSGTIDGFFRLQRSSLVHMIADIEFSRGGVKYRLHEKRRFKLNEIHYLDHPKFGIIARVSPY